MVYNSHQRKSAQSAGGDFFPLIYFFPADNADRRRCKSAQSAGDFFPADLFFSR